MTASRALVIGGTGTISRGIVRALLARGSEVTIFTRGTRAPLSDGVRVVTGDRSDHEGFAATFRGAEYDVVIDMISYDLPDTQSAVATFRGRTGHFIHCSTVNAYGFPLRRRFVAETDPSDTEQEEVYGSRKAVIDEYLLDLHRREGFPATIVRPAMTYGPGVILFRQLNFRGEWIDRLRKGKAIVAAGDGDTLWHRLSAHDAGDAFALLAGNPAAIGQVVNLVHPEAQTWDEWHRAAAAALGVEADIVHVPGDLLRAIEARHPFGLAELFLSHALFDSGRIRALIPEWSPRASHVEAIAETIEWMDREGIVPDSDEEPIEDRIVALARSWSPDL